MPEVTLRRVLNEAQEPNGMFEAVNLRLYEGVETRPTEHVIELSDGYTQTEASEILEKLSDCTVEEEGEGVYRITVEEA